MATHTHTHTQPPKAGWPAQPSLSTVAPHGMSGATHLQHLYLVQPLSVLNHLRVWVCARAARHLAQLVPYLRTNGAEEARADSGSTNTAGRGSRVEVQHCAQGWGSPSQSAILWHASCGQKATPQRGLKHRAHAAAPEGLLQAHAMKPACYMPFRASQERRARPRTLRMFSSPSSATVMMRTSLTVSSSQSGLMQL